MTPPASATSPRRATEHESCDACGLEGSRFSDDDLLASILALARQWRRLIDDAASELRLRPQVEVWSALEYLAHSRDITALHAFGVEQALTLNEPAFAAVDGEALIASAATSYNSEDASVVLDAFETEAKRLAAVAEGAPRGMWSRGLTVGDDRMDVRRLLEHALHDSVHHINDVQRGLTTIRATAD